MDTPSLSDDLRRYFALLWQWAWLLILATVLTGGVAYLVSRRTTPVYQAATTLLINEAPATRSADYASVLASERLARTYTELITKKPVLEAVIAELDLPYDERELKSAIQVELVRDTQLIELKVEDTDPQRAAEIANTMVAVFTDQNQTMQAQRYAASKESLEAQLADMDAQIQQTTEALARLTVDEGEPENSAVKAERDRLEIALSQFRQTYAYLLQTYEQVRVAEAGSTSNVVQVEAATQPESPIRPRLMLNTALAGLVGLMLATGVIFLTEALDDTVKIPDDVTRHLDLPVLGLIARHEVSGEAPLITVVEPRSPVAEAFRSLRTNIQFASVDYPLQTLLVTSPSPADGKSTIAANLGVVLAQSHRSVALIDADMRKPMMHRLMSLPNRAGFSALFVRPTTSLDGALQETAIPGLFALTSGELPPNPAELLGSEKMWEIIHQVNQVAEVMEIDSPPVMAVTDASVLAPRVDGVLLVIRPGKTKLAAARQAVEQLRRMGANLLGVVLNEVELGRSRYSYYHYKGYYYAYHYSDAEGRVKRPSRRRNGGRGRTEGSG